MFKKCTSSKRINGCGGTYREEVFPVYKSKRLGVHTQPQRTKQCMWCLQTHRDDLKRKNRFREKARQTRKRHAKRWNVDIEYLKNRGWRIDQMAEDMQEAYTTGCCPNCDDPFSEMPHGLSDLTVDRRNINFEPIWLKPHQANVGNISFLCHTCNSQKSTMSAEKAAIIKLEKEKWKNRKKELSKISSPIDRSMAASFDLFSWAHTRISK